MHKHLTQIRLITHTHKHLTQKRLITNMHKHLTFVAVNIGLTLPHTHIESLFELNAYAY